MNDVEKFEQLVKRGYPCISIVTYEEAYTLHLIRSTSRKLKRDMWIWSASTGVRDGLTLLDQAPAISGTESPENDN